MAIVLSIQNVTKEYDGERLFEPLSLSVKEKERMAIIGPNGTGKSTLLKMILREIEPDSGSIVLSKNLSIGYLSQDVIENPEHTLYEEALTVFKDILSEEKKLEELAIKIADNPFDEESLKSYSAKESSFQAHGGYEYKYKIALILNMFNFKKEDYERKISSFSGGEKSRLAFAKLLLLNPDILILDEPTNHLDIISIEWLEDYLSAYQGTIIFVSHDMAFVKKLAKSILEIENKVFTYYNCTYDNYCKEKRDRYLNQLAEYKKQEEQRKKLERFIAFYMPKPRFASRAKDRVKKLERLNNNAIDDPSKKKEIHLNMSLKGDTRTGKRIMDVTDLAIGYDHPLITDINFSLFGQDHLAIMGSNGIGKSTLGRTLLGELKPLKGNIRRYFTLRTGLLKQDIRSYDSEETLFAHFRNLYPRKANEEIYSGLSRYGFTYEEVNEKKLSSLSGGELMRTELYQLSLEEYDLLLLDEPTNHLDVLSISELIDALNSFMGTLIIISHDRDFVDKVADKILYLDYGKAYYYEGSYTEFKEEKLSTILEEKKVALEQLKKTEKKVEKKDTRVRFTRLSPEKVMMKIDRLEERKKRLEDSCLLEENYTDNEKMKKISLDIEEINKELQPLYEELEKALN